MNIDKRLAILQTYTDCVIVDNRKRKTPPHKRYYVMLVPKKFTHFQDHARYGMTEADVVKRVEQDIRYWMAEEVYKITGTRVKGKK
jgi:hypothetical protein